MTANRIESELLTLGSGKSGDRDRRLEFHLRRGLRYGEVADVANLAMLFVRGVPMPVPGSLHGKQAHRENQGHRQQT
jgi:hypothetical protein